MISVAFLCLASIFQPIPEHAIYIAIVEINYNGQEKTTDLRLKVFTDDLKDVLRNFSEEYVLQSPEDFAAQNSLVIGDYFRSNLKIAMNGKVQTLKFVGAKEESDAHFLKFSLPKNQEEWTELQIEGTFFTELFPEQSNVVNLQVNEKRLFARLTKANPKHTFTFD